jgi:hypothetical protein
MCHSSGDKAAARALTERLRSADVDPWLDDEQLLPGQDWEHEIRGALRASHAVLVCLSHTAVSKAGFVQREIKMALDLADEQPEGAIFVIPVKLEECAVPERLKRWQWVDYFDPDGFLRLLRALTQRAEDMGANSPGTTDQAGDHEDRWPDTKLFRLMGALETENATRVEQAQAALDTLAVEITSLHRQMTATVRFINTSRAHVVQNVDALEEQLSAFRAEYSRIHTAYKAARGSGATASNELILQIVNGESRLAQLRKKIDDLKAENDG